MALNRSGQRSKPPLLKPPWRDAASEVVTEESNNSTVAKPGDSCPSWAIQYLFTQSELFVILMDRILSCSRGWEGLRFSGLGIPSLLFADDVVFLSSSVRDLQHSLDHFAVECEAARMRISTSKS